MLKLILFCALILSFCGNIIYEQLKYVRKEETNMAGEVKFNCRVNPRNSAEFQRVMNVIQPNEKIRQSRQHKERIARTRESFKNLAFKIK